MLSAAGDSVAVSEWYSVTSLVGLVVLLLVGVLSLIVVLASFLVTPRRSNVTLLFFASIVLIGAGALVFTYVMGVVFSLLVP